MIFSSRNTPQYFYVYLYLREDGTPYYVGKGKDRRAWTKGKGEVFAPRNHSRIIIVAHNLSESESLLLECKLIRLWGRKDIGTGILRNKTDGGDGTSGMVQSQEQIQKRVTKLRGQKRSSAFKLARTGANNANWNKPNPIAKARMLGDDNPGKKQKNKDLYRKLYSGTGSVRYDHTVYNFKNTITGEEVSMTQYELRTTYNLDSGGVNYLIKQKRKTVKGWVLV